MNIILKTNQINNNKMHLFNQLNGKSGKSAQTGKMQESFIPIFCKPNLLVIRSMILMLMLLYVSGARAQTNTNPAQTVSIGNEPYLVTATPGSTYTWTITPGVAGTEWRINGTGNNITVDWNIAGVYTLSVVESNSGGCIGQPHEVVVTVNESPGVIATSSAESICSGASTNISLSSNIGTATFAWTAALTRGTASGFSNGTGPIISQTLTNISSTEASITYIVTPTVNGITGTPLSVVVTVNPLPKPTITTAANPVCFGTAGVNYTTESGMNNYSWTISGGLVTSGGTSSDNTVTVTWNGSGPYSVIVNYHDANGCISSAPATQNVTITPLPTTSPIYHN
jgi:PKD-like domain